MSLGSSFWDSLVDSSRKIQGQFSELTHFRDESIKGQLKVKLPVSPSAPLTLFDAMHLITDIGYHTQFYAEDQAQTLMHARQAVCQLGYTPQPGLFNRKS